MAAINPYINFNGNAAAAFAFYKSVFGGEFSNYQTFGGMPSETPLPAEEADKVLHVSFPIGNTILMASDIPASYPASIQGTDINISINADSEAEADKIFNGLSEGGKITMPMEKTFWGAYFGMLTDKFGIQWMVNYDYKE